MNDVLWQQIEDLRKAARFVLIDGYLLEADEAERIGMMLAELAGAFAASAEGETPMTKLGHRQFLDSSQVKSSSGSNRDVWPLRIGDRREDRTGAYPALMLRTEPVSRLRPAGFDRG